MHKAKSLIPIFLFSISALLLTSATASASTFYLRPNGVSNGTKAWAPIGASTAWEALDDSVTELETPTTSDYIQATSSKSDTTVPLKSISITGVSIAKAEIWYYAGNSNSFQVKSNLNTNWQTSSSAGWHSRSETITSQSALDNFEIRFFADGTSGSPRQVRAAFLKIETSGPGAYWGAWIDGDVYKTTNPELGDAPWDATTWDLFEAHAEKRTSIVHFGQLPPWEQGFTSTPLKDARERGTLSMEGTLPMMDMGTGYIPGKPHSDKEPDNRVSLGEINEGLYDSDFKKWAEEVEEYGYPFFFRWGWEMNGTWYKWGKDAAENPKKYVQAWQRIHDIAKEAGASNITWVWCPNVEFTGSTPLAELYPGNEYVDWTCLDGYNKGGKQFSEIFSASYSVLVTSIAPSKPIMVGETATVTGAGHLSQYEWIRNALQSLPTKFPKIKAFLWFNWNIIEEGKEWEWPIEWSELGQKVFAEEIQSPYFASNEFGEPTPLQSIKPLP